MSVEDWDGLSERRAPMIISEQLARPRNTVEAPVVMVLVGFAAVLIMQAMTVWSHGLILQNQRRLIATDRQFACYVVHTSQGEAPNGALSACGFINLGEKP